MRQVHISQSVTCHFASCSPRKGFLVAISWPFFTELGIGDFWASILGAVKKGKAKDLSSLKGKRVGISSSIRLHQLCNDSATAQALTREPRYPASHFVKKIKRRHDLLVGAGAIPFYVFDGRDHSMKKSTRPSGTTLETKAKLRSQGFSRKPKMGMTLQKRI